jgi:hypothetical protein
MRCALWGRSDHPSRQSLRPTSARRARRPRVARESSASRSHRNARRVNARPERICHKPAGSVLSGRQRLRVLSRPRVYSMPPHAPVLLDTRLGRGARLNGALPPSLDTSWIPVPHGIAPNLAAGGQEHGTPTTVSRRSTGTAQISEWGWPLTSSHQDRAQALASARSTTSKPAGTNSAYLWPEPNVGTGPG